MRLLRAAIHEVPGPIVERRCAFRWSRLLRFVRALELLPPAAQSDRDRGRAVPAADGQPARLRVAAGGSRRHRDSLRPRNDGAPGARDDVPLRRRGAGRDRFP